MRETIELMRRAGSFVYITVRRGADAFAEVNALEEGAARAIARNALQRLNHGSVLIDAEPTGGG